MYDPYLEYKTFLHLLNFDFFRFTMMPFLNDPIRIIFLSTADPAYVAMNSSINSDGIFAVFKYFIERVFLSLMVFWII